MYIPQQEHSKTPPSKTNKNVKWWATLYSKENKKMGAFEANKLKEWFEEHAKCYTFQLEAGDKEQHEHFQCVFVSNKRERGTSLYKKLEGLGLYGKMSFVKGDDGLAKLRNYCKKEATRLLGPFEGGWGEKKEKKATAKEVVQSIKEGKAIDTLATSYPEHALRSWTNMLKIRQALYNPPERDLKVYVHLGKPGTGKTTSVIREHGEHLFTVSRPNAKGAPLWFDGYDADKHTTVLFDDFYGWAPITSMLAWLDRAQTRQSVFIKGGSVAWRPAIIYITSNKHWKEWYKQHFADVPDHVQALHRRFTEVREFSRVKNWKQGDASPYRIIDRYNVEDYDHAGNGDNRPKIAKEGDSYQPDAQ